MIGPMPKTDKHNKYILVISDYFTKWTEALPILDMLKCSITLFANLEPLIVSILTINQGINF